MALRVELAETSTREKLAELRFGVEWKVATTLQGLEKSLATLRARIEAKKTAVSLAYFQERSNELVAMGAELLTEGKKAN